jgi:hypothetical protein
MGELNREDLAAMTDPELLAYEREHPGDLYMSLLSAKGMVRVALQLCHVGATRNKADELPWGTELLGNRTDWD